VNSTQKNKLKFVHVEATILLGVIFSIFFVIFLIINSVTQRTVLTTTVDSRLPIHLIIPKINVGATIEPIGLSSEGAMGVPKNPSNAAWFKLGPYPGDIGSAVIDGHFGWKDNLPAVFDRLSELQKDDLLYVKDANGITTTFVVRMVQIYREDADASNIFTSRDGKAHLNLITCEGVWNAVNQSYSDRLVVFADKE
jgi:LPXTG-site transpeptidase (sortase) family protein